MAYFDFLGLGVASLISLLLMSPSHINGHTDGHMALLHMSTHSLIVGDHCVGQGSAILDITSGGNMTVSSCEGPNNDT
uniref:Uncharacterized protein n=1 Tax=Quercus lobata TaxID=97700 RepID=A0A7N2QYB9_QUELO